MSEVAFRRIGGGADYTKLRFMYGTTHSGTTNDKACDSEPKYGWVSGKKYLLYIFGRSDNPQCHSIISFDFAGTLSSDGTYFSPASISNVKILKEQTPGLFKDAYWSSGLYVALNSSVLTYPYWTSAVFRIDE